MIERVAIVGTREATPEILALVDQYMRRELSKDAVVVSGDAKGVDRHAADLAIRSGRRVREFAPDYEQYQPKIAPIMRNTEIANYCTRAVAFPGPNSSGTWDLCRKVRKLGKPVLVIYPDGRRADTAVGL